jgi:hypothetical protein
MRALAGFLTGLLVGEHQNSHSQRWRTAEAEMGVCQVAGYLQLRPNSAVTVSASIATAVADSANSQHRLVAV